MLSVESKKNRLAAVESLMQFIECAIHAFILSRCIYPRTTFGCHMRFGIAVWLCDVKAVKLYVKQICLSLQNALFHDRVKAVTVVSPSERFTIELPTDFAKSILLTIPEGSMRTELEIKSICARILRDTLIHVDRKLGKGGDEPMTTQGESWEVIADIKKSEGHGTETVDMPSGWIVDSGSPDAAIHRRPIKSALLGDKVLVSTYTDIVTQKIA